MKTVNGKLIHPESAKQQKLTQISEKIVQLEQVSKQNAQLTQQEVQLLNSLQQTKKQEIYLLSNLEQKINHFDDRQKQQIIALEKIFNRKIFPLFVSAILFTTLSSFFIFHYQKDSICEYQSYSPEQIKVN